MTVSAELLAAEGQCFDVVLNMKIVEHVLNLPAFMQCCSALVRPDGLMFIATINRNPWSWLIAIVGAEYVLGWLPRGTHQWSKLVTPEELDYLRRAAGLRISDITGVNANPFNRHFSFTDNLKVNYMPAASCRQPITAE